ncbi:MAG TPA: hypothetical protein VG477_12310, partial [Thermoanaerobaculia bacterium]|nr:hypothetical protein [Thermoanaerobaculia bacterium]
MRDSLRKTWLASLWLALALAVPFAAPLAAQGPIEGWDTEYTETEALVTQWDPSEGELAVLEDTWAGEVDIPGEENWTWFVQLTASASQVLVAPPIDPDVPYQQGIDFDGYVQNGALQMNFTEPGVYAVTIYY